MRLWNLASTRLVFQLGGITYVAAPYGEVTPEVADNVLASSGIVQGTLAYLFTGQQSREMIQVQTPNVALGLGPLVSSVEKADGSGWRDMIGQIYSPSTDQGFPIWTRVGQSFIEAYKFALDDHVQVVYHIQHDYQQGTPLFLHPHWTTASADPDGGPTGLDTSNITWEMTWEFSRGFGRGHFNLRRDYDAAPAGHVVTSTGAPDGIEGNHCTSEIVEPITEDAEEPFEPDGILIVKYHRIGNDVGPDNADNVFLLTADVHYLADRTVTLERQPPFAR